MLIHCPKCFAAYEIDEKLIPDKGKKLRCSNCAEVFVAGKADLSEEVKPADEQVVTDVSLTEDNVNTEAAVEDEPKETSSIASEVSETEDVNAEEQTEKNDPMDDIFQRLSVQTAGLFKAESELPSWKRLLLNVKKVAGLNSKLVRQVTGGVAIVLLLLCFYAYRFEVVRSVPFMRYAYSMFGIQAVVPGEGLTFENVVWNVFEEDYVRKLEIKGFIVNTTDDSIGLPIIHIELLDKDAEQLQATNQVPTLDKLPAGERLALNAIIRKPSPLTKYVYVTFVRRGK